MQTERTTMVRDGFAAGRWTLDAIPQDRIGQVQTDLRPQQRQRDAWPSPQMLLPPSSLCTSSLFFSFLFFHLLFSHTLVRPPPPLPPPLFFYPQFPLLPFLSPRTLKNKKHPPLPGSPKHKRDGDTPIVQPRVDFVEPVCSGCLPPLQ